MSFRRKSNVSWILVCLRPDLKWFKFEQSYTIDASKPMMTVVTRTLLKDVLYIQTETFEPSGYQTSYKRTVQFGFKSDKTFCGLKSLLERFLLSGFTKKDEKDNELELCILTMHDDKYFGWDTIVSGQWEPPSSTTETFHIKS